MCTEHTNSATLRGWLKDPMIRLVMESDRVSNREMLLLVRRVSAAVALRREAVQSGQIGTSRASSGAA